MMKHSASRWRLSEALVALLILAAQALLPALAHASPPDPSWIPGIYDGADYDDVVLLATSGAGSVTANALDELRPWPPMVATLGPRRESAARSPRASAIHSRAPPAL
jgi:hypothetical protein